MEIRDPVHGNIPLSEAETAIIDTPQYQRLRAIRQLGFAEFSFPGATHNRYLHSIGVCHIAGLAFDQIFHNFNFSKPSARDRLRQTLRLASLLHDIGHGPLSHVIEEVMPPLKEIGVKIYSNRRALGQGDFALDTSGRATHEDYTIKYLTDSPLTETLKSKFPDLSPVHIACLVDKTLVCPDDFFIEQGVDFRPILSQLVSSELDCDRMDFLERDSYFCGTNYGRIDLEWLINNLIPFQNEGKFYLGLNRRALYSFDDFLLSRHHMHLMVYFHHKSIIYEEMLNLYLTSPDCSFFLPSDINEYTKYTDHKLYEHLAGHENPWARRITLRQPYRVLMELHNTEENSRPHNIYQALKEGGMHVILASSNTRLSKYHSGTPEDRAYNIFVVDQYDRWDRPMPIDQSSEIFRRYEGARIIDRLYVAPEEYDRAEEILKSPSALFGISNSDFQQDKQK